MFFKCSVLFIFIQLCSSALTADVTFKNVTIRGYSMFTEKFKKTIKSSNSLKDNLPELVFDAIEIKEQNVPILYKNSLADLGELDELVIEYSNVYEIRPGALKNVPMLRKFSLKGNKIEEIPSGVFNNLEISTLDLSFNFITIIDSSAFDNMPSLLNINLADNRITTWDEKWFFNTPLLSRISMQNNSLQKIPKAAFKNLAGEKRFGKIDLSINLVFTHNEINEINPEAFKGIEKINNLWLDHNQLDNFNENLLEGVLVKDFRIDHNQIKCLDGNLEKILKADSNQIDSNPFDCKCLEEIKTWTKQSRKHVVYFFSDMECATQRIKTKMEALNKRLKEIRGNKDGKEDDDVENMLK